jgi:two-component system sensor histidine kinase KdpD
MSEDNRPDPDALLARIQREEREREHLRGRLRIYLGAFPGVGKTYAMLSEAQRRKLYGEDVVVGFVETHGRRATATALEGLDVVPRKRIEYRGVAVEEMDVDAILRRRPAVCLVDELAHTNVAGSEREKRYEDVQVLLEAGIDVVSTLNIQHLESLNDTIQSLTGVRVRETLPDSVLDEADEVILIDLSPEGARARMEHGHIYPPEQARAALENYFTPENLAVLREMALRRTAEEVDEQLEGYMREMARKTEVGDRILVLVDEQASSRALIRHAWRLAQGLNGELMVAYLRTDRPEAAERDLARNLELAEDLNGRILPLEASDWKQALPPVLKVENVNHVVMRNTRTGLLSRVLGRALSEELAEKVPGLSVYLVSPSPHSTRPGIAS